MSPANKKEFASLPPSHVGYNSDTKTEEDTA
jgi:hypothetical protein